MVDADKTASAQRVRAHLSALTRAQFHDLTRRLVLYAARLLRGASLDHLAYETVTRSIDLALAGTRTWDPAACPFDNFIFGVVRSRASMLRQSAGARLVRIAAQLPAGADEGPDVFAGVADDSPKGHPALSVEQEQEIEQLILRMAHISETLARVFVLAIYEGRSNIDIARRLNLSVGDVVNSKKRLQRALKKIYADPGAVIQRSARAH